MSSDHPPQNPSDWANSQARFDSTQWSIVLQAGDHQHPASRQALETLCQIYWAPLYSFFRRNGHPPADAKDLTQSFFQQLLSRNSLAQVAPDKGRFRSFLLASARYFAADAAQHALAQKRGAGAPHIPLHPSDAETDHDQHLIDSASPEHAFDRRWAQTLLDQAKARLKAEFSAADKLALYENLGPDSPLASPPNYAELAPKLGLTETNLRSIAFRIRQRYAALLREETARTLADPSDPAAVDEELRQILRTLNG